MAMSSFSEDFICGVCHDVYKSPRLLPCHHSFCLFCIEGLARANGSPFPCPQCRDPVQLPPQGALGFKANFYIKEEDLERARTGFHNVCPVPAHSKDKEPLILFCVGCDKPLCMRCKVTAHEGHETEDLSMAADKCQQPLEQSKKRLDEAIKFLKQKSDQARGDLEAARMKSEGIKEEIKLQRDAVVAKLDKTVETVMKKAAKVNRKTEEQLEDTHRSLQKDLDSLVQLRQRLSSSLGGSDADKVYIEKEMRMGAGSTETLKVLTDNAPVTTFRQVLHTEVGITDLNLSGFIGEPNMMPIAMQTKSENITPFVQLEKDKLCRRIHSLTNVTDGLLYVSIGGLPPRYSKAVMYTLDDEGKVVRKKNNRSKRAHKEYPKDMYVQFRYRKSEDALATPAKTNAMFVTEFQITEKSCVISSLSLELGTKSGHYRTSVKPVMSIKSNTLIAFDALASGKKFAMIEEFESQDETESDSEDEIVLDDETKSDSEEEIDSDDKTESVKAVSVPGERVVRLYDPKHKQGPVATYIPPREPFLPMDLCFWHHEDEDLLLIAEWQNDCIHVVDTRDNKMEFVRFLAAGSGNLVRPTALNVSEDGIVWIGCDNGWILKCQKIDTKAEHDQKNEDGDEESSNEERDEHTEDGNGESSSEDEDTEMAVVSIQPPSPASTELSLNDDGILPSVSSVSSASSSRAYRRNDLIIRVERNGSGRPAPY